MVRFDRDRLEDIITSIDSYTTLSVLSSTLNVEIPASSINVNVLSETDISSYRTKTLTIRGTSDSLSVKIYCYDSSSLFNTVDVYHSFTLSPNISTTYQWTDDFIYCKILASNSDTVNPHTISLAYLKGRKL